MASLAEEIPVGFHGKLDAVSDPAGKLQNAEEVRLVPMHHEQEDPRMNEKLPDLKKDSKISEGVSTKTSFLNYNDMLKKMLAIDDIHGGAFDMAAGNGVCDEALSKNGITALLPAIHLKMEESERRFGNGDHQTWNLQIGRSTGKSPSFDFGVPFDAASAKASSGFDETPLLLHPFRKTPVRSLSINDFQDRIIRTRYGRNSVDYDAKSEAPFLNNNNGNDEKTQESFGSDDMDYWAAETKLKGNGKPKAKAFFSACICCIASTE
ncbi:PREDICTED: uncharacterized protein LOC109175532 [Ipomoea nil]|uniref:uncharacterized protein LOC109175532 n=1 Tax=Ipomoea nil TaxID=35883 RepID=UPI000900D2A0|nr:PREDICTED: uncharacterized protein LOC109175532 [Ipomoea nil]